MLLTIDHISMRYPSGKLALNDLSLEMESPCLIGLLGPNGAGKSTLMKLLVSALRPTKGNIFMDGVPLCDCEQSLKSRLGYLPQSFGLYDELSVWQFLDYMASLKNVPNRKSAMEKALETANLQALRKVRIRTLSGGQRQRAGIAQALLGDPELLILDEPTVGLDPEERLHFRNMFSALAEERIVLLSTHIIEDVQSVCRRLAVIREGKILFSGQTEELIRASRGKVGTFLENDASPDESSLHVTSRISTGDGIMCRCVGDELPNFAKKCEPTLEDAYMYLILREERA